MHLCKSAEFYTCSAGQNETLLGLQVFSLHGLRVLAIAQLSILTTLTVIQTSEWLDRIQGLDGSSNNGGMFAAQNSLACSLVLLSMLNISLIFQLGGSLAADWPATKLSSSSASVGVQIANSV